MSNTTVQWPQTRRMVASPRPDRPRRVARTAPAGTLGDYPGNRSPLRPARLHYRAAYALLMHTDQRPKGADHVGCLFPSVKTDELRRPISEPPTLEIPQPGVGTHKTDPDGGRNDEWTRANRLRA